MAKFSIRLKELRNSKGLSQRKFADIIGMSKSSINMYEHGEREPGIDTLEAIADYFNVDLDYLIGKTDVPNRLLVQNNINTFTNNRKVGIKIPVLGTVAAGIPIEAIEDILDYEEIPEDIAKQGTFFGLQIKGDSMSPRMVAGDVVIVRQQSDAESGDIVIAKINGDEACCKKLLKQNDGISLISFNPTYEPMYFNKKDIENKPVIIIGKVVELRGKF